MDLIAAGSGASGHSASWGRTNQPTSPPYESHLHSLVSDDCLGTSFALYDTIPRLSTYLETKQNYIYKAANNSQLSDNCPLKFRF